MKASEVLCAARKLIEKPENWTKGTFGFDASDDPKLKPANVGCAIGACRAVIYAYGHAAHYLDQDARRFGFQNAIAANDSPNTTHKQVLRAFDRCIKAAEAAGE